MRVVLFTNDLEPITIINLTGYALRHLQKHGTVTLPVFEPLDARAMKEVEKVCDFKRVRITAETLFRRGQMHFVLFTSDEESAMLLKASFLPGQRWQMKEMTAQAFARGFLHALEMLGGAP